MPVGTFWALQLVPPLVVASIAPVEVVPPLVLVLVLVVPTARQSLEEVHTRSWS